MKALPEGPSVDRRVELVSQWQDRLASAESLAAASTRFRWMHLARVRLYRFLLSCYGSRQWREDMRDEARMASTTAELELPLVGKPPKSVGAIQAVLKAVHTAQDHMPPAGPLTGGLEPQMYVAVTGTDARMDVGRCETYLLDSGLHPRVVGRGRRLTVEVPHHELRQAQALIDSRRDLLRPRLKTSLDKLRHNPPVPEETQMLFVGLLMVAPVSGMAVLTVAALLLGDQISILGLPGLGGLFLGTFLIVVQITLLWYVLAPRWRTKVGLTARRRTAIGVCWLCIGLPAALVIIAAMRAPLVESLSSPPAILAITLTLIVLIAISFDLAIRR